MSTQNIETLKIPYLETTIFGDYTIKIEQDTFAENPREWDNLGTMTCWHRRYNLGDNTGYETYRVFFHTLSGLYTELATNELTDKQYKKCVNKAYAINVILPLYLYDHSGLSMSSSAFNCPWDSGKVGFIFASHDAIRREYNVKRISKRLLQTATNSLKAEVETYDQHLGGDVYQYTITKNDDDNEVDSCSGFFGQSPYMVDEIKNAIKSDIENTPQQLNLL